MKPVKLDNVKEELKSLMEAYQEQRCELEDELTRINNAISNFNSNIENINIIIREINDLTERKNIAFSVNEVEPVDEIYVDIDSGDYA